LFRRKMNFYPLPFWRIGCPRKWLLWVNPFSQLNLGKLQYHSDCFFFWGFIIFIQVLKVLELTWHFYDFQYKDWGFVCSNFDIFDWIERYFSHCNLFKLF
jgi:hypothetical protein